MAATKARLLDAAPALAHEGQAFRQFVIVRQHPPADIGSHALFGIERKPGRLAHRARQPTPVT